MSPGWPAPISMTPKRHSSVRPDSVNGTQFVILIARGGVHLRWPCGGNQILVVVLPALPVIAMMSPVKACRFRYPKRPEAWVILETTS